MSGFLCQCGGDTKVINSRHTPIGTVRRRRECITCRERISTFEIEIGQYHQKLKELLFLYREAGRIVREMGPERETQPNSPERPESHIVGHIF